MESPQSGCYATPFFLTGCRHPWGNNTTPGTIPLAVGCGRGSRPTASGTAWRAFQRRSDGHLWETVWGGTKEEYLNLQANRSIPISRKKTTTRRLSMMAIFHGNTSAPQYFTMLQQEVVSTVRRTRLTFPFLLHSSCSPRPTTIMESCTSRRRHNSPRPTTTVASCINDDRNPASDSFGQLTPTRPFCGSS